MVSFLIPAPAGIQTVLGSNPRVFNYSFTFSFSGIYSVSKRYFDTLRFFSSGSVIFFASERLLMQCQLRLDCLQTEGTNEQASSRDGNAFPIPTGTERYLLINVVFAISCLFKSSISQFVESGDTYPWAMAFGTSRWAKLTSQNNLSISYPLCIISLPPMYHLLILSGRILLSFDLPKSSDI